eukprot:12905856-Prorocentrum_lima.AAC.1
MLTRGNCFARSQMPLLFDWNDPGAESGNPSGQPTKQLSKLVAAPTTLVDWLPPLADNPSATCR